MDDLSAHEAELLAVVQHRVEVLNPGGIRWAVQDDPLPLLAGENKRMRLDVILVSAPGGGCHVPEGGGEHPVTPLVGRRVETPVKLRHGDRLGVNNGGDHLKRREENMLENYII